MKHVIIILLLVGCGLESGGQCINQISTNPANPQSQSGLFPMGFINPYRNNFNWAELTAGGTSFKDIVLNSAPGYFNSPTMISPYTTSMPSYYSYLLAPGNEMSQMDVKWEDGWELLYMNTGFFPNGDDYSALASNNPYAPLASLTHSKIPYIILYNRYRGIIRVFVNLIGEFGEWDNIHFLMEYADFKQGNRVGTLFRHKDPYDRPADQGTIRARVEGQAPHPQSSEQWASFDFQIGFDPCGCSDGMGTQLVFKFKTLEEMDLELYGRALEGVLDVIDFNPGNSDFLGMHTVSQAQGEPGAVLYKHVDGLLEDYKKKMLKYESDLQAYNSYKNNQAIQAINALKSDVITGLVDVLPTPQLAKFIAENCLDFKHGESTEFFGMNDKQLDEAFKDGSKELLAQGYDFLNLQINGAAPNKPVRPSMPTVSATEMSFSGTLTESAAVDLGKFYTPGDLPNGFGSNPQITPQNYPVYNEKLGLYTLLKSPRVKVLWDKEYNENYNTNTGYGNISSIRDLRIMLDEPLSYYLNPALDFDHEKTTLYGSFIVTLKNKKQITSSLNYGASRTLTDNRKMSLSHSDLFCPNQANNFGDCRTSFEMATPFLPLETFGEQLFMSEITSSGGFYFQVHDGDPIYIDREEDFDLEIEKIELKVMADMYFEQIGTNDEQVNTTQSFTYLLLDRGKVIDNQVEIFINEGEMELPYYLGELSLGEEVITPSHSAVHSVINNDIYIKYEHVIVGGGLSVQSGYNLIVMAKESLEIQPTTIIEPNVTLIGGGGVFNTGPIVMVTHDAANSFCTNSYGGSTYNGNVYTAKKGELRKARKVKDNAVEEINLEFELFPNPASSSTQLKFISNQDDQIPFEIAIYDLKGIKLSSTKGAVTNGQSIFEIETETMNNGVYFVVVNAAGKNYRKKLVVQR